MTAPSNDNRGGACPICDRQTTPEFKPFCSQRCTDVDLGRWLDGKYAIPSATPPDEEDMAAIIEAASERDPDDN